MTDQELNMKASQKDLEVTLVDEDAPLNSDFYLNYVTDAKLKEKFTSNTIAIPLKDAGEEVDIDINDLPDDPEDISNLLQAEKCAAKYWILVARSYAGIGKIDAALKLIQEALKSDSATNNRSPYSISELTNCSAWLNIMKTNLLHDTESLKLAANNIKISTTNSTPETNQFNILADAVLALTSKNNKGKRTKFEKESRNFDLLLQKNPKNCYALIGKGKLFFYRQNYLSALIVFQKVLQLNPLLRPDPRIGIGLCYWFLDRKDLANQAWQNSIQVNPTKNLEAKILISIAKFDECFSTSKSDEEFKEKYIEAMSFATASYNEDSSNQVIQIILASYFFSKGEIETVRKICDKILNDKNTTDFIKSETLFWLARCKLLSNDVLQAQKMFSEAIKLNENNTLARVGVAQCLVIREEFNDAIRTLEKVQEANSNILEVIYALGMLYSKIVKFKSKAISYLEKYVKISDDQNEPISVSALIALSKLYEETDISKSLHYLLQAKDEQISAGKTDEEISGILFNNIGVFSLLENQAEESEKYFNKAYDNIKKQYIDDPVTKDALEVSLKYNIARSEEVSGKPEKIKDAMKLYNEIIEKCPHYTSAKIRWLTIACLSQDMNVRDEVQKFLEEESDDLEVRSFYGWYLKNFGSKQGIPKDKARDMESLHHRETLTRYTSHDCYAIISMANIYCVLAREVKEQVKKDQYYLRAGQLYQKALNLDSKNAYAAQGIAIILAERKQTGFALEIFRKIRDSLNDITVYLNMGHCLLGVKQFAKAIESYQLALTRFTDGKDARLLNYFARAWLLRGMSEKNLECYRTAFKYVNQSYEINPIPAYKFNITYIEYQFADFIRKLPPTKRTMEDLEKSIKGLENSIIVLNSMADDNTIHPPYPAEDLRLRAKMGSTLLKKLEKAVEDQKEYEEGFENKLKEAKKVKEEENKIKLETEIKEEEERKKIEDKLIAERKELEQQQQEWNLLRIEEEKDNQDVLEPNPEGKEKKKRGRKKANKENDDEESPKKKKKTTKISQKASSLSNEFIDDSDEDADFSEEMVLGDENEDEAKSSGDEGTNEEGDQKLERKKAIIEDDEEDENDGVEASNNDAENTATNEKIGDEDEDEDDGLF